MRATSIVVGLLLLGAAACGSDDDSTPGTDAPTETTTAPSTTTHDTHTPRPPADPDAAVLTFDDGSVPAITADGRVFVRTDQPQGFRVVPAAMTRALPRSPAVGSLMVGQLTPDGLAEVLAKADDLGLLQDPPDYGEPGITDQGYLTLTLTTADGSFEHRVYAPGEDTDDPKADAARERLDEFVDYVDSLQMQLDDELSDWKPYVPEQWVIDTDAYVFGDAEPWAFDAEPNDGCVTLPIEGGVDTVSGIYTVTGPGSDEQHLVEVRPALPFTAC